MLHRLTSELVIRSPWRPFRPRPAEQSLVLAGGSAFPPNHPTTRLCLDLLKAAVALQPPGPALDVGCGSGILSLAALSLGVPYAVAVDLAGRAVRQTAANARRNHLLPIAWAWSRAPPSACGGPSASSWPTSPGGCT